MSSLLFTSFTLLSMNYRIRRTLLTAEPTTRPIRREIFSYLYQGTVPEERRLSRRWLLRTYMPRLGSSLEDGRDDGVGGRSLSLGRRRSGNHRAGSSGTAAGRNDGDHHHDDENDGSRSPWGDNEEERDRLLLPSGGVNVNVNVNANANANRPAARRVHSAAYAGAAAAPGCGGASKAVSSRMVALVALCGLVLILRNAVVNVRACNDAPARVGHPRLVATL
jgi:hypothetical protein